MVEMFKECIGPCFKRYILSFLAITCHLFDELFVELGYCCCTVFSICDFYKFDWFGQQYNCFVAVVGKFIISNFFSLLINFKTLIIIIPIQKLTNILCNDMSVSI